MKRKLLTALLCVTLAAGLLAGCGKKEKSEETPAPETQEETSEEENEEPAAEAENLSFEIVSKGLQQQYWQAVKNGVEQKAEELGVNVNFVGPASEADINDQVQMLDFGALCSGCHIINE